MTQRHLHRHHLMVEYRMMILWNNKGMKKKETGSSDTPVVKPKVTTVVDSLLEHFLSVFSSLDGKQKVLFYTKLFQQLPHDELSTLSHCLGNSMRNLITEDSYSFYLSYKNINEMASFNIFKWTKDRNKTLVSFLLGIGNLENNIKIIETNSTKLNALSRAVEHTYMVANPTLISPISYLLNVCAYAITGSKTLVDMLGNGSPAGHYKTVTQWLRDQSPSMPHFDDGDIMNVFDNEQVIGRKHSIKPNNKVAVSIITNKGFVVLDSKGTCQTRVDLKPTPLLRIIPGQISPHVISMKKEELQLIATDLIERKSECYKKFEKDHYEQLYHFVSSAIDVVVCEQTRKDKCFSDSIDQKVVQKILNETMIKCFHCGTLNRKRKLKCDGCSGKDGLKKAKELLKSGESQSSNDNPKTTFIRFQADESEKDMTSIDMIEMAQYEQVESNHKGKHDIIITDPTFCNPNSYDTIARVLRQIGIDNGIHRYGGERRHWTFICCDGLPYLIVRKLQEEALRCVVDGCGKYFLGQKQMMLHVKESHPESSKCQFVKEFDWFYLRIGSGHYEMNLLRSFFELNWIPGMETLCEEMGFVSEQARSFAKSCKDTHKAWNLLLVYHTSFLRELVVPYVRESLLSRTKPDAKGFFTYINKDYQSSSTPNFKFVLDQVCRFSQGIINFRMSIRRNNADLLKSAKYMTKELFHGRHHPKYQMIELYDILEDQLMPVEVRNLKDDFASITTSDNKSTGEDFDFILEEKNRQIKCWIPKGVPSDMIWQNVCRNHHYLEQVKKNSMKLFGITTEKGTSRPLNIEEAIDSFRCTLRRTKYLEKQGDLTSISGLALDEELLNFSDLANARRNNLIRSEILGEDVEVSHDLKLPIPVTPEERMKNNSFINMTVPDIKTCIENYLSLIQDSISLDYHQRYYENDLKGKKKADLVAFLQLLKTQLLLDGDNTDHHNL